MKNPNRTSWNMDFFKGMSFPDFNKFWKARSFEGDPKEFYTKVTGEKLPRKKKKTDDI